MNAFLETLKSAAAKRSAYIATYKELARMPRETAIDLGLFVEDARINAHRAVYGS